jgi:hypothetical protein
VRLESIISCELDNAVAVAVAENLNLNLNGPL